jgi:hypothetical protein
MRLQIFTMMETSYLTYIILHVSVIVPVDDIAMKIFYVNILLNDLLHNKQFIFCMCFIAFHLFGLILMIRTFLFVCFNVLLFKIKAEPLSDLQKVMSLF